MKTVFLDFDGVLFNTLREAYLLCRYAYSNIDTFEPIDDVEYNKFFKYKFLVYNSWQYFYLMKALETPNSVIESYKNYLKNRDNAVEEEFDKKYYAKRADLKLNNYEFWNNLEQPFEFFYKLIDIVALKDLDIVIVSKKDFNSINIRLEQYGLNLSKDKIYAYEQLKQYKEKSDFILEYMKQNEVEKAIFVDDNSNNLVPCRDIRNLELLLAGWGNIAEGEKGFSCEEVIDKIKQL